MQIRPLAPPDAPAFQALRLRGLQECPEAFASSYEEEVNTPLPEIEDRLRPRTDAAIFGAFQDAVLCALVGLKRESKVKMLHKAFIWGVYVAPEVRGRGIGSAIMAQALRHAARVLGTSQVNLGVNTKNTAAVALYQKLGFVEYGLERGYLLVDGELQDEYQMVCHVGSRRTPEET